MRDGFAETATKQEVCRALLISHVADNGHANGGTVYTRSLLALIDAPGWDRLLGGTGRWLWRNAGRCVHPLAVPRGSTGFSGARISRSTGALPGGGTADRHGGCREVFLGGLV